ncbi:MAG: sulfite exporter TauE/SafE family protein [Hyphomicrobiaceae bacterium]
MSAIGGVDVIAVVVAAFLLAGFVKGVCGLGLPSVSIGVLSLSIGLKPALALLLVPSFVTNVWQAISGGSLWFIIKRTWLLLLTICVGTWAGVGLLAYLDARLLSMVLGATLMAYAALGLTRFTLPHPGRRETWVSAVIGVANGVLAGMTGSYVAAVPFLQSLGWSKDLLVQAMGIVFTVSTIALAVCMVDRRLVPAELALGSVGAVVPALAGMYLGQIVRGWLSEARFRQVFYWALMILGAFILIRAAGV